MADTSAESVAIGAIMEALGPMLPLDDMGQWAPTYQPQWPKDYSRGEQQRARGAAMVAVEVIKRLGWTAP